MCVISDGHAWSMGLAYIIHYPNIQLKLSINIIYTGAGLKMFKFLLVMETFRIFHCLGDFMFKTVHERNCHANK